MMRRGTCVCVYERAPPVVCLVLGTEKRRESMRVRAHSRDYRREGGDRGCEKEAGEWTRKKEQTGTHTQSPKWTGMPKRGKRTGEIEQQQEQRQRLSFGSSCSFLVKFITGGKSSNTLRLSLFFPSSHDTRDSLSQSWRSRRRHRPGV